MPVADFGPVDRLNGWAMTAVVTALAAMTRFLGLNSPTDAGTPIFDISNLQFRLYEVASSAIQPGLGIPAGSTLITAWTGTSGPSNGAAIQASFSGIQAGTYFLDVAGTADGSSGGTYVGQLNLAPVPLPAALPLLISGLGLIAGVRRRRTAIASAS